MDKQIFLTTIFTPTPLLEVQYKKNKEYNCTTYIKKAAIPLTCCFYYAIKEDHIWTDILQNPITASIYIYAITYYSWQLILQNQQNKIDQEIINMMQHVFHLLIIGQGVYNKITNSSLLNKNTMSAVVNSSTLITLQLFLNNAYNTWLILFSYYKKNYKTEHLYTYHMNQISLFEVLQASTHEPEILSLITNFYNKNNITFDYEPIFNCLEIKLKQINHKMKSIIPNQFYHPDEK